ncbi:oxygen-independent coproporphyrinogen III oxidase [Sulfitobacter sp. KE34]|uniref:oxygen-independent coproporphyrinogen III oxidase n=1 Tax=unclassified Sulfitobacter TaxID=196795 RepID=UPI0023E1EBD8|nr:MULTISPECIES: oxygen-independent coproporphyrinogen III oxidase [unclassified Sulfitobacter]MDF3350494.1 oxygen-independent coproporphyrinogen III oxidase [Sulfitobacter sp. KE12]MDF3354303.1 oxygen-independent coproporphyrinogen III oxidase [Sulfitobacter sp. KE27]MDF3357814.1 oxygen-independent coproporphyrinogen III oxidase [Sulfitobacter sp. KE33]MDF3365375.1 oxygen-independent coproporphyrinogen III oxidase [Sulfitobacter sp. Ks34]MDF3368983.1 oxygen-independent coproporphyrinogen III 
MEQIQMLEALGLFDARVPRYTSYPTAAAFTPAVGAAFQRSALGALDPGAPVSAYIHIPFCERLCYFCACHTQGTKTLSPVERYIEALEAELELLRAAMPAGMRMGRMHWGGGTPTILPPTLIERLNRALHQIFTPTEDFEFSVEIDPTQIDPAKIAALRAAGLTRASIGIQDFDPEVQQAIGRLQSFEVTRRCVGQLRAEGVTSLNADLVYGLPHQTMARLEDTIDKTLSLAPDRVALFGYAHVPWVAKRQKLIREATLPDAVARYHFAERAAARFAASGMEAIGIDHFATPQDGLTQAKNNRRLRRNFQGYTDDNCQTLIGLGASSISRFPGGYVQNAPATAAYTAHIAAGDLPGTRGYALNDAERLTARAIECLMCDFTLDLNALAETFGAGAFDLAPELKAIATRYTPFVRLSGTRLDILPEGRALTRMIASMLDQEVPEGMRYSQAS